MAIDNISNIDASMTFQQWWTTTNEIISELNNVVTMGDNQNNTGNIITTYNPATPTLAFIQSNNPTIGVKTNALTPLQVADNLTLNYNTIVSGQKQIFNVPASGLSSSIQFQIENTPNGDVRDQSIAIGPVPANGKNHGALQITLQNPDTDPNNAAQYPDGQLTIERPFGVVTDFTKAVLTGTNLEIDNAILPSLIQSTCSTAVSFTDNTVINFGGATAPIPENTGHVTGQIQFNGSEGNAIEAELAVDFSSAQGVQSLTVGSGLAGTIATFNSDNPSGTISHADTSSVVNVLETSPTTVLTGLTFDTFGHVTETSTEDLTGHFVKKTANSDAARSIISNFGILVDDETKISFRKFGTPATSSEAYISTVSGTGGGGALEINAGSSLEIDLIAPDSINFYSALGGINKRFSFSTTQGNFIAEGDITAFGNASDRSLKENIEPITDALNKVDAINGYTFNYIDAPEKGRVPGVIAQELEQVLPEAVYEIENGKKAVRYDNTVALLVEAIKELKQQVDELKGK